MVGKWSILLFVGLIIIVLHIDTHKIPNVK